MNTPEPAPNEAPAATGPDDLRPVLERIAGAIEKHNEAASKQGKKGDKKEDGQGEDGDKKEGGDEQEGEDGDKQKEDKKGKDDSGKDQKESKAKHFFLSPLGIILTLVMVAVLVIGLLALLHYEKTHESTDDAYTTGHVHQVSPRVSGLVTEIWVDDNQAVKNGDLLVKLDPKDYEVALQRAVANLDQAKAQVLQAQTAITQAHANFEQSQAQITQARAQTTQAGASYEVAGINYGRNKSLSSKDSRAVAQADVDTTKSSLDSSRGAFDAAKANVQAAEGECGRCQEYDRDPRGGTRGRKSRRRDQ